MPHNKNQHFVPRCLLRPFTLDGNGASISLFNIARGVVIPRAPARHQCSKDYFYDDGGEVEKALAALEGEFAIILRKLENGGWPNHEDRELLLLFLLVQWRRTEAAIEEQQSQMEDFKDKVFLGNEGQKDQLDLSHRELVQMSLKIAFECIKYAEDLKSVIIQNKSQTDFIISDNPAVLTNRLHLQKWNERNFAMQSSGAIFTMPLGPKLATIAYDRAAYTMSSTNGVAEFRKNEDAEALNDLQILGASRNLYFSQSGGSNNLAQLLEANKTERDQPLFKNTMLIEDSKEGDTVKYRVAKPDEMRQATLTHTERLSRKPRTWFSPLSVRPKIRTFENGSSIGHVRKTEWLEPDRSPPSALKLQPAKTKDP